MFKELYSLSSESQLLNELGLTPPAILPHGEKVSLGTVTLQDSVSVEVLVTAAPARFWEFRISTAGARFRANTGSGSLRTYWPFVLSVVAGAAVRHDPDMFDVVAIESGKNW